MAGWLKEIGKRVSLYDIIQEAKEADSLVEEIEDLEEKYKMSFYYLSRQACRAMFRVAGDLEIALAGFFGYSAASIDPEQVKMCVLLGVGGVLTYLADYTIFDQISPLPKKDGR